MKFILWLLRQTTGIKVVKIVLRICYCVELNFCINFFVYIQKSHHSFKETYDSYFLLSETPNQAKTIIVFSFTLKVCRRSNAMADLEGLSGMDCWIKIIKNIFFQEDLSVEFKNENNSSDLFQKGWKWVIITISLLVRLQINFRKLWSFSMITL